MRGKREKNYVGATVRAGNTKTGGIRRGKKQAQWDEK